MQNTAGRKGERCFEEGGWRSDRNLGKFEKRSYFNFNDSARAVLALDFGWKFRLYHWLTVCLLC